MRSPGWYPDPQDPSRMLYFNGFQWTDDQGNPVGPGPASVPRRRVPKFVFVLIAVIAVVTLALAGLALFVVRAAVSAQNAVNTTLGQVSDRLAADSGVLAENGSTGLEDGEYVLEDVALVADGSGAGQGGLVPLAQGACRIAGTWHDEDVLDIHESDAEARGIADGGWVTLASRVGSTVMRARISDRVPPGVVYTTFHFPLSGANVVTTEYSDWATNCPEYKVTAVEVGPTLCGRESPGNPSVAALPVG